MTTTRIIREAAELEDIVGGWAALVDDPSLSPTTQPRWFCAAAGTLYTSDQLRVMVVEDDGAVVAVAPLAHASRRGKGHLEVLGCEDTYEAVALAHRDPEALRILLGRVVAEGRAVHLGRLATGGPELRELARLPRHRSLVAHRSLSGTPFVPTTRSWGELEGGLSATRRHTLRKRAHRAERAGGLRLEVVAPGPAEVDTAFDQFMEVENRSWKGERGTSLAADLRLQRFYRGYARAAGDAGELRVCRLEIGGGLAAAQLAVERGDRLWVLKLGYDPDWSSCSPGMLLTWESLRWALERGLSSYEFLGDVGEWKSAFTSQVHAYTAVRLYPLSARSMVELAADAVVQARRRLRASEVARRRLALRRQMGAAGRRRVERHHDADTQAARLVGQIQAACR